MTLNEFDSMRCGDAENHKEPMYVFDSDEIFDYSNWNDVRKYCDLICTLASVFKPQTYLIPKYANATVYSWGEIDNHLCVVIEVEDDTCPFKKERREK